MLNSSIPDFYLFHQKFGDKCLLENDIDLAAVHYTRALELNPFNLFLIAHIANTVKTNPATDSLLPLLTDAVHNALKVKAERFSVYEIARNISYVNQKIIQANYVSHPPSFTQSVVFDSPVQPLTLVLLTCVWQRPDLTQIVLSYYQKVRQQLAGQVKLVLLAVGSEGDASRKLCESCGFHYLEHENLPLSDKWEFGLKSSLQFNPDGVVTIGSDDLISAGLFLRYALLLKDNYLFCGLTDAYFLDLAEPRHLLYWRGYGALVSELGMPWRLNETLGMGRLYSRVLLDWLNFSLWPDVHINKGLDGAAKERLFGLGILPVLKQHAVPVTVNNRTFAFGQVAMQMADLEICAVDIKSPAGNVTSMASYQVSKEAYLILKDSWSFLERNFPVETVNALKSLAANGS